jgi:hypothetical protein
MYVIKARNLEGLRDINHLEGPRLRWEENIKMGRSMIRNGD